MKLAAKTQRGLDEKFRDILNSSDGFVFFVKIHDFIGYIEARSSLAAILTERTKSNRELKISSKYESLKQVYQGVEDTKDRPRGDLGHERYMIIGDLNKIRHKEYSENIAFWKKREGYKKFAQDIYNALTICS